MSLVDVNPQIEGASNGTLIGNVNDALKTADILNSGTGVEGSLTVGTSATEAKVGANKLTNRKLLTVHNNSSATIYWGFTSSVTTSTGTPIFKDQVVSWSVGDSQTIYLIAGSAGNNTRVTEGA